MDIAGGNYQLTGLKRLNIILGKNGSGKSTLLKQVESGFGNDGTAKYITPERGGNLDYEPHIEQSLTNDPLGWLSSTRRVNQLNQFRQQAVAQFRRLELTVLRASEKKEIANFDPYIEQLNTLLDNVEVRRVDPTFKVFSKHSGNQIAHGEISSGEAELITLGIEALAFAQDQAADKQYVLFMDEPDVHLHPDLQARLMKFLADLVDSHNFTVVMATHSTAILGALADTDGVTVAFLQPQQHELQFEEISEVHKRVLPVFGAHPLSNIFNEAPALIVEGEDDERIWQQAVRSSSGRIRLYPVASEGVTSMSDYEREVRRIIGAVYENAKGFSLRDRDGTEGEIDDDAPLVRMKLQCRTAENLILSDDVLAACGTSWTEVQARIANWLDRNGGHAKHGAMAAFRDGGFDRAGADLKEIRTVLVGVILNSSKSWEVLVGQAIANLQPIGEGDPPENSLEAYLGPKAVSNLLTQG